MKVKINLRIIEAVEIEIEAKTMKEAVTMIGQGNFENILSYRKGDSWIDIESVRGDFNGYRSSKHTELCEELRSS